MVMQDLPVNLDLLDQLVVQDNLDKMVHREFQG